MKIKNTFLTLTKVLLIVNIIGYLSSCHGSGNDIRPEETYEIKVIDSCESRRPFSAEFSLTHKGNCKYCSERKKRDKLTTKN